MNYIKGIKWYPFLVEKPGRDASVSLLASEGYNPNYLYVRFTVASKRYLYTRFRRPLELKKYIESFPLQQRCFDEVILEGPQKARFDIDIDASASNMDQLLTELLDQLIQAITTLLPELSIERQVRIFTSHGDNKRSLHLILDNCYHDNYLEARAFYQITSTLISPSLCQYLDPGIYGKIKQLRMLGCSKWQDSRVKILNKSFYYKSQLIKSVWEELETESVYFLSSLITAVSGYSLPSFTVHLPKRDIKTTVISETSVQQAIELAIRVLGKDYTYSYEGVKEGIILLKRLAASYCIICQRIHEKQHPFLFVINKHVYFNCRRSTGNQHAYLGTLDANEVSHIEESTIIKECVNEQGKTITTGNEGFFFFGKKSSQVVQPEIVVPEMSSSDTINLKLSQLSNPGKRIKKVREKVEYQETDNFLQYVDFSKIF